MTGLALLQAAMAGKNPPASIAETVPMKPVAVEEGYIRILARADGRHLNPLGAFMAALPPVLDSVTGCAVHSTLGAGIGYGTVDLQVKMLRPVPKETDLIAEGRLVYAAKTWPSRKARSKRRREAAGFGNRHLFYYYSPYRISIAITCLLSGFGLSTRGLMHSLRLHTALRYGGRRDTPVV